MGVYCNTTGPTDVDWLRRQLAMSLVPYRHKLGHRPRLQPIALLPVITRLQTSHMSSSELEKTAVNLLGIPGRPPAAGFEALGSSNQNTAPATAWEIYNSRAAVIDRELIKDWNASLNTLLVFVSTFSLYVHIHCLCLMAFLRPRCILLF